LHVESSLSGCARLTTCDADDTIESQLIDSVVFTGGAAEERDGIGVRPVEFEFYALALSFPSAIIMFVVAFCAHTSFADASPNGVETEVVELVEL